MRRVMMLVTVVLLITAMLAMSTTPARAAKRPVFAGTPLPTVVCDVVAGDSRIIGWRDGACWVLHPVAF